MLTWYRRKLMGFTSLSLAAPERQAWVAPIYGVWSKCYDASMAFDPAYRRNAGVMVDRVVADGDRVLDVGMGTGLLAELCSRRACHYVGIDFSPSMLAKAARKVAARRMENVVLRWGDARALPYGDGEFDVVVSSFMLPHFEPAQKAIVIAEMARVLKAGGRLGLFLAQGEIYPLFSTRTELEGYLGNAGLDVETVDDRDDIYRIATASKP